MIGALLPVVALSVAVGLAIHGYLDDAYREPVGTGVLAGLAIVLVLFFSWLTWRSVKRQQVADRALRSQHSRMQTLLHTASDGIHILDAEGRLQEVSDSFCAMLGYTREEMRGMHVSQWDAQWSRPELGNILGSLIVGPSVFETRHRRHDGTLIDVEISTTPVELEGRTWLYASARDITGRKRMEEALQTSEERWKFALEGAGDGVLDWNLETGEFFVSRQGKAILGYGEDFPIDTIQQWEALISPRDSSRRQQALGLLLEGQSAVHSGEYRTRCGNGQWKWILVRSMVARRDHDGHALRISGTLSDIDDQKRRLERDVVRARVMEMQARGAALHEILGVIISGLEQLHPDLVFGIFTLNDRGRLVLATRSRQLSVLQAREIEFEGEIVSAGNTIFAGTPIYAEPTDSAYWKQLAAFVQPANLAPCWSEAIVSAAARPLGALLAFRRTDDSDTLPELETMQQAAYLASATIQRKNVEDQLQLALSIYETSGEAILVVDPDNAIVAVNPAFTEVTGYRTEEVLGRNPGMLKSGRHDQRFYQALWSSVLETGRWQGEIWNRRKNGEDLVEWLTINTIRDEFGEVYRRVAIFSDITEKKKSDELIWLQANYDALTGLPNRSLFRDRLLQAIKKSNRDALPLALFFIDLDHFKEINDTLGHKAGDQLLIEAARRITACVRDSDTVARLGGDEFTVVLPSLRETVRAEQIAQEIIAAMAAPFVLGRETAYVSASIGITLYPTDASDPDSLEKAADQAMYAAKTEGRNRFSFFTGSMQVAAQERQQLVNNLHRALEGGQFQVYYQPIVDLPSGRIVKAEALLRWHHPEHGLIHPAHFIPVAEETGLIHEIGDWVFHEVAGVAKRWQGLAQKARRAPGRPESAAGVCEMVEVLPIQISINKSPRQFLTGDTNESWIDYLRKIDLPVNCIAIEITEGLLLDNRAEVSTKLL
ncbi:MAG: diguanylate cyclase, partial [Zoogloea sp.]|nr:diguanylate cyclase [Zoogloea sp.]